jgi:GTP cyclohydrolase I
MADFDPNLGKRIQGVLVAHGIETPIFCPPDLTELAGATQSLVESLGLDMSDDSIKDTPSRIAKMYAEEVFYGLNYNNFPKCTTIENKMRYDEVIVSDGIEVLSMCEHHFVPFVGTAHIGYIPNNKVLGLSKFNRVTDFFARRPQVQERLTEQIHAALSSILETEHIAVVIKAQHFCVKLRGVKDGHTQTHTSKLSGRFRNSEALRAEFFSLIGRGANT